MGKSNTRWHQTTSGKAWEAKLPPQVEFPVDYPSILARIEAVDAIAYARSRNFVDGAVSYLSPYISRGVISTRQVLERTLAKGYTFAQAEKWISELAWRDYFQRVWQARGNDICTDLRQPQPGFKHRQMIKAIVDRNTGIEALDNHIGILYQCGYIHNHVRMYLAAVACNVGGAHWLIPAQWMYYHLLDGDAASNHLSWQWVAGAFSGKKYYANQENINRYTGSTQRFTWLDQGYDELVSMEAPEALRETMHLPLDPLLPDSPPPNINPELPLLIYNTYNLDPQWRKNQAANRLLLLEPSHFARFPVSPKVLAWIVQLAQSCIPGLQVFAGEVGQIPHLGQVPAIYAKEHPAFAHYPGHKDPRDWLAPEVSGYFPSFFAYWKKIAPVLKRQYA